MEVTEGYSGSAENNSLCYGPWLKTTNTYGMLPTASTPQYYALNYDPTGAKFVQIRFRVVRCNIADGTVPKIVLEYDYTKNGTNYHRTDISAEYSFDSGYYQTVTMPLTSAFKNADAILNFGFRFQNLHSSNSGCVQIDYIYIGAQEGRLAADPVDKKVVSQVHYAITSGVRESHLILSDTDGSNKITGYMTTVAPNAKVTFKASFPGYYEEGSTQASRAEAAKTLPFAGGTTTSQAFAYEAVSGDKVLFATNADFSELETRWPRGYLIMEGNLLQEGYGADPEPYFAVLKNGSFVIRDYGESYHDVQEAVSGRQWLVKDGKLVENDDELLAPRNSIGLKADGTLVTFLVDGRQEHSVGMTIQELAEMMYALGCVDAINLDGGGSATYASVHNTTGELLIRNSPSDGTERPIASTLLMVSTEDDCAHRYTGKKYTTHANGTHTLTCDLCGEGITMEHRFTNGSCVCGAKKGTATELFFGFTDTAADRARYNDPAYGYHNFDLSTYSLWKRGYWASTYNGSYDAFSVDPASGTLKLAVTNAYSGTTNIVYGPWIKTTTAYSRPTTLNTPDMHPLAFHPSQSQAMQIRFKISGCEVDSGKTPMLIMEYCYEKDGTRLRASDVSTEYSFKAGAYLTLTIPLTTRFTTADLITNLGFRFQHLKSSGGGEISIDYIYFGKRSSMPEPQYTVTFVDGNGKTLATQYVNRGASASYSGATPTKAYNTSYHYSFKGWDKSLSNITADTTITAQFTATAHSYSYSKADNTNHKCTCSCGYSKSVQHTWNSGSITTQPTCTASGVKTYTCTACKATKTEAVSAKGHTVVTDKAVAASCTTAGKTEGSHCSVCNAVIVAQQTVPATGHSYVYTSVNELQHSIACKSCDYSKTAAHSLTDGSCICGETLRAPALNESFQIYHSLNLASDISVNYAVPKSIFEGFDMETVYLEVETNEYEGNTLNGQSVFKLYPVEEGNYYYFTLTGLSAVRMNNELRAVLHGQKGIQPYYSATDLYSIASYAYSQLSKSATADELKTLCADLLRYGSAAQIFKGYRTDSLADSAMTEEHKVYLSDADSVSFGNHNAESGDLEQPAVKWLGKTLDLNTKVSVMYVIDLSSYTGDQNDLSLRVTYENIAGEQETVTLTELTPYGTGGKYYTFTFDALLAAELRTVLSATVYEEETQVSNTLTYSADTYANGKSGTLLTLCKALFAYSDSAKTYFAS